MSTLQQKLGDALRLAKSFGSNREIAALVRQVRAEKLTYLDVSALLDLYERVQTLEQTGVRGIMIEAGCALGGSTIVLANAKSAETPLYVYDTFSTIPPPSEHDAADAHQRYENISAGAATGIKGDTYYGYQGDLRPKVTASLTQYGTPPATHNIHLVQGLYEDTLRVTEPVAFAHIDCDWYDSVWVCLEQIVPNLVAGGALVIDDYNDWEGCRRAVDAYFADKQALFRFEEKSRLHIIRR